MSTSESFTHIYSTLASGQLKPAISMLISKADEMRDSEMKERILTMNETYTYLLQYLASGTSDPQRKSVYNSIRNSLYECADSLFERQKSIESHNFVYTQKQYLRDEISRSGMSLQNLINRLKVREELNTQEEKREHENTAVRMFNHIWLMGADTDMLADLFNDESIPMTDKCLAISALTIHLLRKFDIDEAMLLTSLCEYDDDDVAERALVGLLPIMTKYNDRLTSQVRWRNRIEAMMDLDGMKNAVKRIITQYMRTNETEELVKELNDEILPEMKKLSKDIENADIRSIISEDGEDVNPQWQDKLDKSGLTEKLKRFSDLQMEGSDVYMSTFAMLKSFPFFLYVANWFRPFDPKLSVISQLFDGQNEQMMKDFFNAIMDTGSMCDSDRYSFSLSLMQMPDKQRQMLADAFTAEKKQELDIRKDDEILAKTRRAERISNSYIQTLYRFYKLFNSKKDFESPFKYSLKLHTGNLPDIARLDDTDKIEIAEYAFSKGFYNTAYDIYETLKDVDKSLEYYQKMGYCKQKMGDMLSAIEYYKKAEVIAPDDTWTLMRMAYCYRQTSQMKEAAACYGKAYDLEPNKTGVLLKKAICQIESGEEKEALAVLFKIDYETQGNIKLWRLIVSTCLKTGKTDQAKRYSEKAMGDVNKEWSDLVASAHIRWIEGDLKGAIENYRQAIRMADNVIEIVKDRIVADRQMLKDRGCDVELMPMILDELK